MLDEDVGGPAPLARGEGVSERLGRLVLRRRPGRRAAVQVEQFVGGTQPLLGPEQLGEHPVVPVGGRPGAEADHEPGVPLQLGQDLVAVGATGERVDQTAADPLGDGTAPQDVPGLGGETGEHLHRQVVGDAPMVAGELVDEPGRIRVARQCERGEPQPGRPAFGPYP